MTPLICCKSLPALVATAICLAVFGPAPASADRLDLREGDKLTPDVANFADEAFLLPEGERVQRGRVADWWLAPAQEVAEPEEQQASDGTKSVPPANADSNNPQEEVRQNLLAARTRGKACAARHPGCSGVIVTDHGHYTLTADHRHVYRYHFVGYLRSDEVLPWAQLQLGYSEGRSRRRILAARCLSPDGRVFELDPAAVKRGAPSRGAVHFDPNARQLSATIPGAEVGGLVEYITEYEAYNKEDWRLFFPGFHFQMGQPCLSSRLKITVPRDQALYSWTENWDAAGESVAKGDSTETSGPAGEAMRTWTWHKEAVPPVVSAPQMPPASEIVPSIHASLFSDWEYLNEFIGSLQQERMDTTPAVKAKTQEIVAGLERTEEKVAALYHWVQKNVRYVSIKGSLSSGWTGHPAAETLAQGYGDCTDKSILLATMLEVLGFDAAPVVVRTNDRGDFVPKYPVLTCNHAITQVEIDGHIQYLDSTTQDHRYPALRADDHGVIGYNFLDGTRRRIPVPPPRQADTKTSQEQLILQPDGTLLGTQTNTYAGRYEAGLRGYWKRIPESMRKPLMQQYLNRIAPSASLRGFELTDAQDLDTPFTMHYTYRISEYAAEAGDVRIFQFPDREQTFTETAQPERQYPIVYTTARHRARRIELKLPDTFTVVQLPKSVTVDSPHLHYRETLEQKDQTLTVVIDFAIKHRRIPLADCPGYIADLNRIATLSRRPIYFEVR